MSLGTEGLETCLDRSLRGPYHPLGACVPLSADTRGGWRPFGCGPCIRAAPSPNIPEPATRCQRGHILLQRHEGVFLLALQAGQVSRGGEGSFAP